MKNERNRKIRDAFKSSLFTEITLLEENNHEGEHLPIQIE